jgi:hypothetical protein
LGNRAHILSIPRARTTLAKISVGKRNAYAALPTHSRCSPRHRLGAHGSPFCREANPGAAAKVVDAFIEGMRALGYTEGRDFEMEYRWVETIRRTFTSAIGPRSRFTRI